MEKIEISKEKEQKLEALFKELRVSGICLMVLGIILPGFNFITAEGAISFVASPMFAFFIVGILLLDRSAKGIKAIKENTYQAYKAICRKKKLFEYVLVDNNEILSKKVKKPLKWLEFLGSRKAINEGTEVGVLQIGKLFNAFSLDDESSSEQVEK